MTPTAAAPTIGNVPALLEQCSLAPPLKVLLVLTLLALLPAIILTTTSFVRTVVVLSFVRQGVGAQSSPPSQGIIGLSMFLTLFTMSPVVDQDSRVKSGSGVLVTKYSSDRRGFT